MATDLPTAPAPDPRAPSAPLDPTVGELIARLRRAEGQLRGVQRLLADGADPHKILTQLAAAKAAVDQVGLRLISDSLRRCVDDGAARTDDGACSAQFEQTLATFLRFATMAR
ncbi:MAG TPA: metal-sensitive transcriptional regulator [Miltoncostaeaceae bacterium]|nr:metal-sensitive transcriptional regulator [Miltoncostaeaceae bacterium]